VKHLLHGLPPVQQRVAEMRAGRAPGPATSAQANAEMEESQVFIACRTELVLCNSRLFHI